jgi:hypothetical protein
MFLLVSFLSRRGPAWLHYFRPPATNHPFWPVEFKKQVSRWTGARTGLRNQPPTVVATGGPTILVYRRHSALRPLSHNSPSFLMHREPCRVAVVDPRSLRQQSLGASRGRRIPLTEPQSQRGCYAPEETTRRASEVGDGPTRY